MIPSTALVNSLPRNILGKKHTRSGKPKSRDGCISVCLHVFPVINKFADKIPCICLMAEFLLPKTVEKIELAPRLHDQLSRIVGISYM